jgi:hypothetical protein
VGLLIPNRNHLDCFLSFRNTGSFCFFSCELQLEENTSNGNTEDKEKKEKRTLFFDLQTSLFLPLQKTKKPKRISTKVIFSKSEKTQQDLFDFFLFLPFGSLKCNSG